MDEHKAAVALREAAADFAAPHPVLDAHDRAGQRRNRKLLNAAVRYGMTKKRGYSRDFKPHGDTGKRYLLDDIPAGLWREAREKAKREGVSMRALILKLIEQWVKP